jgi:uncharacterized RDD family membrane protein YckC
MEGLAFRNIRNVTIVRQRAAIGARMAATLIDFVVIFAYSSFIFLFPPTGKLMTGSTSFAILFSLPVLLYHLLCETFFNGKSVGKYTMGTRVMRRDGSAPGLGDYLLRWIFRLLDMMFAWAVGIISIILTSKGQRIGDIAAGTVVVRDAAPTPIGEWWSPSSGEEDIRFKEAASLTDQEVKLLREALERHRISPEPLHRLVERIKQRTGLRSDRSEVDLARTLIEDHDALFRTSGEEKGDRKG